MGSSWAKFPSLRTFLSQHSFLDDSKTYGRGKQSSMVRFAAGSPVQSNSATCRKVLGRWEYSEDTSRDSKANKIETCITRCVFPLSIYSSGRTRCRESRRRIFHREDRIVPERSACLCSGVAPSHNLSRRIQSSTKSRRPRTFYRHRSRYKFYLA